MEGTLGSSVFVGDLVVGDLVVGDAVVFLDKD